MGLPWNIRKGGALLKIMNSDFSRVHLVFALFAALNVSLGLGMTFSIPFMRAAAWVHFLAGVLVVLTPWLVLPFLKNPKPVWTSFKVRLTIRRSDLKNPSLLTAKIAAWLFIISLLLLILGGIMIKSGLAAWLFPDINVLRLHTRGVILIPVLLLLHVFTMMRLYGKKGNH
jgi:hypothetical protein